ncbi:hypothetical protein Q8A67_023840 [Cirrhinus molitorella]|uniref:Uncharacterized protein n=1 Tax=Cirrhinus molitorella TaxID=172907 RepID=A0AA88TEM2_9TELE|nr:hypothetical protein Q8A67_023840 [Cirrhinus molitorella]
MFQGYLQKALLWHTAARAIRADIPQWRELLSGMDDCGGQVRSPGSPSVLEQQAKSFTSKRFYFEKLHFRPLSWKSCSGRCLHTAYQV